MNPRLWLLDTAVELRVPLHWLAAPNVGEMLNRRGHGLSPGTMAALVQEMVDQGELAIKLEAGMQPDTAALDTKRILSLMTHSSDAHQACWYGMTPAGGAIWERHAHPDWSRFSTCCLEGESGEAWLEAAGQERAEELVRFLSDLTGATIEITRADVLGPWEATYWKTLPRGHRLGLRTDRLQDGEWLPAAVAGRWSERRRWRKRIDSVW